jgi:hypothetical protein
MFKTLSAALIAASVLIAPMAVATANAGQPAKSVTITTKTVKLVKHKRHAMTHHWRHQHVKHVRHFKKHSMQTRRGKLVRTHRNAHVVIVKPRVRAN